MFQGFFGPVHTLVHVTVATGAEFHMRSSCGKWALLAAQTCRHSNHSSVTAMGLWGFTQDPECPSPSCTGTWSPLATSKGSHFAVVTMASAIDLSHSHMPPLTPAELLI